MKTLGRDLERPASSAQGWFRTALAGPGSTLTEAFACAESAGVRIPHIRHVARDLFGFRLDLRENEGEGFFNLVRVRDDMFITLGQYAYRDARSELAGGDGLVQFCFNLAGDMRLEIPGEPRIRLHEPSVLVYVHPHGVSIQQWTPACAGERIISLNLPLQSLTQLLGSGGEIPQALRRLLDSADARSAAALSFPLSPQLFALAKGMLDIRITDSLALLHVESMAMQLLCVAFRTMHEGFERGGRAGSPRQMARLHQARKVIESELSAPPSIDELARRVGMCATLLKRGFREEFGESVAEMSRRLRMEHSLELLKESHSIALIARAVGYRHQSTFSSTFLAHFGASPRQIRRRRGQ